MLYKIKFLEIIEKLPDKFSIDELMCKLENIEKENNIKPKRGWSEIENKIRTEGKMI